MDNPYSPPQAPLDVSSPSRQYGGIRRLPYFGITFGLGLLQNLIVLGLASADPSGVGILGVFLVFMGLSFAAAYYRLLNIGMNPWWCLALIIPIANILIGVRCLAFQEGYADTKKLDTAGRIIVGLFLALIALVVLAVVFAVVMAGN